MLTIAWQLLLCLTNAMAWFSLYLLTETDVCCAAVCSYTHYIPAYLPLSGVTAINLSTPRLGSVCSHYLRLMYVVLLFAVTRMTSLLTCLYLVSLLYVSETMAWFSCVRTN